MDMIAKSSKCVWSILCCVLPWLQESRKWQIAANLVKDDAPVAVPDDSDNVVGGNSKTKSKSKKKEEHTTAGEQDMTFVCVHLVSLALGGPRIHSFFFKFSPSTFNDPPPPTPRTHLQVNHH